MDISNSEVSPAQLGGYIRCIRKKKRITQVELARMMQVTENTVCSWEKGKTLDRACQTYNTIITLGGSLEELIQFEVPVKSSSSTSDRGRVAKGRKIIGTDRIDSSSQDGVTE